MLRWAMEALLGKFGHELPSVRLRALRNVRFKIENGLAEVADLVQNRHAVGHLVRWLRAEADETTLREVLELLLEVAQHPASIDWRRPPPPLRSLEGPLS